ncbi:MAG TPA: ribonuclease P protein component [Chitinophagaceae bacterium]|nr:ribonuclease P protein component [Chitinophagaceae bacterium]
MAKQFTLGKNERLKSRKLIEQLFNEGKTISAFPFRVYYMFYPRTTTHSSFTIQFGAGVSGKNFRKAVDRNRIKRLTREAYRLQKHELQEVLKANKKQLNVFFIYTAKELPDFDMVSKKLGVILNKLIKIINETNSSNP